VSGVFGFQVRFECHGILANETVRKLLQKHIPNINLLSKVSFKAMILVSEDKAEDKGPPQTKSLLLAYSKWAYSYMRLNALNRI
jgi:hypothetical protein